MGAEYGAAAAEYEGVFGGVNPFQRKDETPLARRFFCLTLAGGDGLGGDAFTEEQPRGAKEASAEKDEAVRLWGGGEDSVEVYA